MAILAANALVSSHLDYCNSLFGCLSCFNQNIQQSLQNTLAPILSQITESMISYGLFCEEEMESGHSTHFCSLHQIVLGIFLFSDGKC